MGGDPLQCPAQGQCSAAGKCNPATGACSSPDAPDDTPCEDGDPNTIEDKCIAGVCGGLTADCGRLDDACNVGRLDTASQRCMRVPRADGIVCDDADACSDHDACLAGVCTATQHVVCEALDDCHAPGTCSPATGACSHPSLQDGSTCDGGRGAGSGLCEAGACLCQPDCAPGQCGDDGCGGSCGECAEGETCAAGECVCAPACSPGQCGDDGCGGSCGGCPDGETCAAGECVCAPACSPGQCGDDGCGGSCGGCPDGQTCTEGACVDDGSGDIACPWTGPFGKDVGKTVEDFTVTDCEGNEVSAHELCGARASLIFDFSGW